VKWLDRNMILFLNFKIKFKILQTITKICSPSIQAVEEVPDGGHYQGSSRRRPLPVRDRNGVGDSGEGSRPHPSDLPVRRQQDRAAVQPTEDDLEREQDLQD